MKIALTCSYGGHMTEMLRLLDAFEGHDVFFIIYESSRNKELPYRKYLLKDMTMKYIGVNPFKLISNSLKIRKIIIKEKPDLLVSTGAEIAIPTIFLGKLLGCHTIFVESICRVKSISPTGRLISRFTDIFLVQWEELSKKHDMVKYWGSVL
jgi:UDP-N-acetylglucosamine:LPS N-acetylglucosamine transferase